jgi:ParB family chromosome partitioning protein
MRSALGKGLEALISGETAAAVDSTSSTERASSTAELPIKSVRPNPKQPRQAYTETTLAELAESIRQRGVLQPILVSPNSDGTYEIIAGERRWRAAQRAGLTTIPAVIKSGTENERFQLALIENIQREDLNPLEQAQGFQRLSNEFHMTQDQIAAALGKDRAVVANTLRLLSLPIEMKSALAGGKISASHARALAGVSDPVSQKALFKRIIDEELTVRAVEQAAREQKQLPAKSPAQPATPPAKSPEAKALEEDLQRILGRKVELHTAGPASKKGSIKLEFYSLDDLDHLVAQLKRVSQTS